MRDESSHSARAAWLRKADSRKVDVVETNNERGSVRFQIDDEDHLNKALDTIGEGFWDWDLQTGEVFYSDRWLESLGYDRGDVSSDVSFVEGIVHPEDAEVLLEIGAAHVEGQTLYFRCEFRLRKKSGDYRWTLGRGRALKRDRNGKALRILGVNFDITDDKAAELFLDQAEQRFRKMVDTAGCVIICLDRNLRILEWNRAAEELSGWTEADVRGKNYAECFLSEEVRGRATEEIRRVLAGGEAENYESSITTRDGTERLLLWNSKGLVNSEGKTWGVVSIAHDITKQKRTEIRREFAHQELQMVLDRFDVLRRILRLCRVCEKIRDREGNWSSLHEYLMASVDGDETNDYCPACVKEVRPGPR